MAPRHELPLDFPRGKDPHILDTRTTEVPPCEVSGSAGETKILGNL